MDYGLPGKELDPGITLKVEVEPMDSLITDAGIILFYLMVEKMYKCVYVYLVILNTVMSYV